MTNKPLAVASLALCILAAGCEPSAKPSATEPRDATAQQLDKAKQEAKEASQDLKDYTYAQKAEFVAQMQVRLTEIQRDLDQLETKLETAGDAAKAETKPKLQALRDQVARLTKQLDEARNATDSTWSEVKAGFNQGYNELKDGFQAARQWLSDKIAP